MDFTRDDRLLRRKIWKMLLPCMLYSAAMEIGNILDNFFAGSFLGVNAIAAVGLGMNIDALTELPGIVLGFGGNALASILIGKRNNNEASRVFSLTLLIGVFFGVLFIVVSPLSGLISTWMTNGNELTADVTTFVKYTLLGAPVFCIGQQLASYTMMDNNARTSSAYIVIANILKVSSEYLLLRYTDYGVGGIALSTIIGYGGGMAVFISYAYSRDRMLTLVSPFENLKTNMKELINYFKPNLANQLCVVVASFFLSIFLLRIGGNISVIFQAISNTIGCSIMWFAVGGIIKLIPAMSGVLYGEGDYFGLKSQIKYITKLAFAIIGIIIVALCVFSTQILQLFGFEAEQLETAHYIIVWITAFEMLLELLFIIIIRYYQAISQNNISSMLTILQKFLLLLPLEIGLALFARHIGVNIYYGILAAQGLSILGTLTIMAVYLHKKLHMKNFWLLPEVSGDRVFDVTIDCSKTNISIIPDSIMQFCKGHALDIRWANLVAVTSEEMVASILDFNHGKNALIDLKLSLLPDQVVLSIRSDGKIFDPSIYVPQENDFSSLAVLNKLADKVQYLRVLDFNSTIFVFKRKDII